MKSKPHPYTSDEALNQFYHDCHLLFCDIAKVSSRLDVITEQAKRWPDEPAVAFQLKNLSRISSEIGK
jgi:hypothetical protein